MEILFYRYECGYGPKKHCKDPNHMKSNKCGCMAHFSIKRLYTWLDAVEITFYHRIHTWANGNFAHGPCDPRSTSWMSTYFPHVFHKLMEFIWTQFRLSYIMKQIYDKHKKNWWEWTNANEWMTWDDFEWLQDINHLDQNHKKGIWHFAHKLGAFHLIMGLCSSWWFFYFQDVGEVNGIHVPFTIRI